MTTVLILGATGYLGQAIALHLRRAGYHVLGLARTPAKAKALAALEIVPVLGDATEVDSWLASAVHADIVIDATSAGGDSQTVSRAVLEGCLRAASLRPATAPARLGYIYTSGVWVHGDSDAVVTDTTPLEAATNPPALVRWRPAFEREVLATRDRLDVLIIRPGMVYGKSGSLTSLLFSQIEQASSKGLPEAQVLVNDRPDATFPLVHVDDVASAYVQAVSRWDVLAKLHSPLFDLVANNENQLLVYRAIAKAIKYNVKVVQREPDGPFETAVVTEVRLRADRARDLLGWRPTAPTFVEGAEVYHASWKASQ